MTSWREIDRIRKNSDAFRALASSLLAHDEITEWETAFLESIIGRTGVKEYSTLQGEKLLQIRDDYQLVENCRSFSVKNLLDGCHLARLDLSEDDEAWIIATRDRNPKAVRRRDIGRLLACARQLNLIEDDAA